MISEVGERADQYSEPECALIAAAISARRWLIDPLRGYRRGEFGRSGSAGGRRAGCGCGCGCNCHCARCHFRLTVLHLRGHKSLLDDVGLHDGLSLERRLDGGRLVDLGADD